MTNQDFDARDRKPVIFSTRYFKINKFRLNRANQTMPDAAMEDGANFWAKKQLSQPFSLAPAFKSAVGLDQIISDHLLVE